MLMQKTEHKITSWHKRTTFNLSLVKKEADERWLSLYSTLLLNKREIIQIAKATSSFQDCVAARNEKRGFYTYFTLLF